MASTVTLSLNDEFCVACLLYNLRPEAFLQEFISSIALPCEQPELRPETILVTGFLIDSVRLKNSRNGLEAHRGLKDLSSGLQVNVSATSGYREEQIEFLRRKEKQRRVLCKNRLKYGKEEGEEAMRLFLKIWLREWEESWGTD